MIPLAGTDLYDWISLRRVSGGGVALVGVWWLDSGRRVPGYVADALTEVLACGLVALADPDPYGLRRSTLTDSGAARYKRLCRQRQTALHAPAPRFDTTRKRAAVDDPDPYGGTTLPH